MKPSQSLRYNTINFSNISGCSGFLRVSNDWLRVSELIKTDILRSNLSKHEKVGGAAVLPTVQETPPLIEPAQVGKKDRCLLFIVYLHYNNHRPGSPFKAAVNHGRAHTHTHTSHTHPIKCYTMEYNIVYMKSDVAKAKRNSDKNDDMYKKKIYIIKNK